MNMNLKENGPRLAAERGTTIRAITKYTATPYSAPEKMACSTRKENRRLVAKKIAAADNAMKK